MIYLYSRVSTSEQDTINQSKLLIERFPEGILVEEQASGTKDRPKLQELLKKLNPQDKLVVYALDRLGRRASETVKLMEDLYSKHIIFVSLKEGIDLSTVSGRMVANIMASVAAFEKERIVERTKTAMARLKAEGKHVGRPTNNSIRQKISALKAQNYKQSHIAKLLGITKGRVSQLYKEC